MLRLWQLERQLACSLCKDAYEGLGKLDGQDQTLLIHKRYISTVASSRVVSKGMRWPLREAVPVFYVDISSISGFPEDAKPKK